MQGIARMFAAWDAELAAANSTLGDEVDSTIEAARALLTPYVTENPEGGLTYARYSSVPIATRRLIQLAFYDVADVLQEVRLGGACWQEEPCLWGGTSQLQPGLWLGSPRRHAFRQCQSAVAPGVDLGRQSCTHLPPHPSSCRLPPT